MKRNGGNHRSGRDPLMPQIGRRDLENKYSAVHEALSAVRESSVRKHGNAHGSKSNERSHATSKEKKNGHVYEEYKSDRATTPVDSKTLMLEPMRRFPGHLLFEQHSRKPLQVLDFSRWAEFIDDGLAERVARTTKGIICHRSGALRDEQCASIGKFCKHLAFIEFTRCPELTDRGVRLIIKGCRSIRRVDLSQCHLLTDKALSALGVLGKTLGALNLEGCSRLTDHGIVGLTKNCPNITRIKLAGCINVGDRSVSAMSQNLSLEIVDISSCEHVTEEAIGELIASFERVEELRLNKLTKLGDACMRNIFESKLLFGYKRNTGCVNLRELYLSGDYSISEVTLTWLGSSCENLRVLNLSHCVGMGTIPAMTRMGELSNLEELYLAHLSTLTDRSLEAFFGGRSRKRLKVLDLSYCELLTDAGLRHVAKSCKNLATLKLARNIDVTDEGLLVLSRHCLLVTDVRLCEVPRITGKGLGAFIDRCSRISYLDISGCTNITLEGLTPLKSSPNLKTLIVSGCKRIASHEYIGPKGPPLEVLDVSRLSSITEIELNRIAVLLGPSLRSIKLTDCIHLSEGAVSVLVASSPNLREVELSGTRLSPESLSRLAEQHRYLDVVHDDPKFKGLRFSLASLDTHAQNRIFLWHLRCRAAARRIQRVWRGVVAAREKRSLEARLEREGYRSAMLIQKAFRGFMVRGLLTKERRVEYVKSLANEAATLVALIRKRNDIRNHKKASKHCNMALYRLAFRGFLLYWQSRMQGRAAMRDMLIHLSENSRITKQWRYSHVSVAWTLWREFLAQLDWERAKWESARHFWIACTTKKLFYWWHAKMSSRRHIRHQMAAVFINCIPLDRYNGLLSNDSARAAIGYNRKRVLALIWQGLLQVYVEIILPTHKIWKDFYRRRLKRLLATRLWVRWQQFVLHRRWKCRAFFIADGIFKRSAQLRGLKYWQGFTAEKLRYSAMSNGFRAALLQRLAFAALKWYRTQRKRKNAIREASVIHHDHRRMLIGYRMWRDDFERRMTRLRKAQGFRKRSKRVFLGRIFKAWRGRVRGIRRKKAAIMLDKIHAGDVDESNKKAFDALNRTASIIQTAWRGGQARSNARDYKAAFAWATIYVQSSIRRLLAERLVKSMRDGHTFKLKIREAVERENMKVEEDLASERRRLDYFQCRLARFAESIRTMRIQAWWRMIISKYRGILVLEQKGQTLKRAEERQAEIEAQIEKAAKTIQRAWRGGASWTNLLRLIHNRKRHIAAIMMQSRFRVRRAFRYLCSLRRVVANRARIDRARTIQAAFLRLAGLTSRRIQQRVKHKFLIPIGLDSDSYVISKVGAWRHLKHEVREDYMQLRNEFLVEKKVWSTYFFDKEKRSAMRQKLYRRQFKTLRIRKGDVIVVTLPGDPDYGQTGLVVDLDVYERFPGRFVAEVLFDGTTTVRPIPLFAKEGKEYTRLTMHHYPRHDHPLLLKATSEALCTDEFRAKLLNTAHHLQIKSILYMAARTIQTAVRGRQGAHCAARRRFKIASQIQHKRILVIDFIGGLGMARRSTRNVAIKSGITDHLGFPVAPFKPIVPLEYGAEMLRVHNNQLRRKEISNLTNARRTFVRLTKRLKGHDMAASINFRTYSYGKKVRSDIIVSILRHHRKFMLSAYKLANYLNCHPSLMIPEGVHHAARFVGNHLYEALVPKIMNQRVWCIETEFDQFDDTPHCRAKGPLFYSGEHSGHPLNNNFVPHGEGLIEFPIGRGYAHDDCELYVTVVQGRNLASSALLEESSNLYVELGCNEKIETTAVVVGESSPKWGGEFCFPVSDPGMVLSLRVLEKSPGMFAQDLVVGVVDLELKQFDLGEEYLEWYTLIDENDRGKPPSSLKRNRRRRNPPQVELKISWIAATEASAVVKRRLHRDTATKLQTWVRRLQANAKLAKILAEKAGDRQYVEDRALEVQCTIRVYWAKRKVQGKRRARYILRNIMFRSYWKVWAHGKLTFFSVRKLQRLVRHRLALVTLYRLRLRKRITAQLSAILVQRVWRSHRSRSISSLRIRSFNLDEVDGLYGCDAVFGTRRKGRFVKAAFVRLLRNPTLQGLTTRFGRVYLNELIHRTPAKLDEDEAFLMSIEKLVVRVPGHGILSMPKDDRVPIIENATKRYRAYLHPSAIDMIKTVEVHVIMIQCLVRSKILTWRATFHKLRGLRALKVIQRKQRRWKAVQNRSVLVLQAAVRRLRALKKVDIVKSEVECITSIQASFRAWRGRRKAHSMLLVKESTAIYSSSQLAGEFSAYRTSDFSESSFWCSETGEVEGQYITYDLDCSEGVQSVQLLAPGDTSAPHECSLYCSSQPKYDFTLVRNFELRPDKGRWQTFRMYFPGRARYWKLVMHNNHGSTTNISLHACLFVRAQGASLELMKQPDHIMWPEAPPVPISKRIELECEFVGWPPPQFQWLRNGSVIEGASKATLELEVKFPNTGKYRDFKCEHCKRGTRTLLEKLVRVRCGYCNTLNDLGKLLRNDSKLNEMEETKKRQESNLNILEQRYKRRYPGNGSIRDTVRLRTLKRQIQNIKDELCFVPEVRRQTWLTHDKSKPWYECEGSFQCVARHVRGGRLFVAKSSPVVVLLGPTPYYRVDVEDIMTPPKLEKRILWPLYRSIYGCFVSGRIQGNVVVRYASGDTYAGPYISDSYLDRMGDVWESMLPPTHIGIWETRAGVVYEGHSVTNHFDVARCHGMLKITSTSGEVYRGDTLGGKRHGIGKCFYIDGSKYEGYWYLGERRGFGCFEDTSGNIYEGEWTADIMTNHGSWHWRNGTSYLGPHSHGIRSGHGLYSTGNGDIYVGNFEESGIKGKGLMLYNDRTYYEGSFQAGQRSGPGCMVIDRGETRQVGPFSNDVREGIFTVHRAITMPDGTAAEETQRGIWGDNEFRDWLGPPSNPGATQVFIDRFRRGIDFQGPFAALVVGNLPKLPPGVDFSNRDVRDVILRFLRYTDQAEVGAKSYLEATTQLETLAAKVKAVDEKLEAGKPKAESVRERESDLNKEITEFEAERDLVRQARKKLADGLSEFWAVEENEKIASNFRVAVRKLDRIDEESWTQLSARTHFPVTVKYVYRGLCALLGVEYGQLELQMLFSSSEVNVRRGDDHAKYTDYDVQMLHLLDEKFDIYIAATAENVRTIENYLADPKVDHTNIVLKQFSPVIPRLVVLLRTALPYLQKTLEAVEPAQKMRELDSQLERGLKRIEKLEGKKEDLNRRYQHLAEEQRRLSNDRKLLINETAVWMEVKQTCIEINDLTNFEGFEDLQKEEERKLDYYESMLVRADTQSEVAVTMEVLLNNLLHRITLKSKPEDLFLSEPPDFLAILDEWAEASWREFIVEHRAAYPDQLLWTSQDMYERSEQRRHTLFEEIMPVINQALNDKNNIGVWRIPTGEVIEYDAIKVIIGSKFDLKSKELLLANVEHEWTNVFPENPTFKAIEARFNTTMSSSVRERARLWASRHGAEIDLAERQLSQAFENTIVDETLRPRSAFQTCISRNDFEMVAKAEMWKAFHPKEMDLLYKVLAREQADLFEATFAAKNRTMGSLEPRLLADEVVDVLMLRDEDQRDAKLLEQAQAWASCHLAEMSNAEKRAQSRLAKQFAKSIKGDSKLATKAVMVTRPGNRVANGTLKIQALAWKAKFPSEYNKARKSLDGKELEESSIRNTRIRRLFNRLDAQKKTVDADPLVNNKAVRRLDATKVELNSLLKLQFEYCNVLQSGLEADMKELKDQDPPAQLNERPSEILVRKRDFETMKTTRMEEIGRGLEAIRVEKATVKKAISSLN